MPRPVNPQKALENKFSEVLLEYKKRYNVDTLDSPNDVANLNSMIRNQLLIERLQGALDDQTTSDKDIDPTQIKKVLDSIVSLSETNMALEKTLGIDRKTRKNEAAESIQDYLAGVRARSLEWLEQRLIKVYCKSCKILVGRISGVYDTTMFEASFQCPQCNKLTVVKRKEQDIFYDVKDADWRRKYPIEIQQPKRKDAPDVPIINNDAELIIGDVIEDGEE